jgi:hypothetical protein
LQAAAVAQLATNTWADATYPAPFGVSTSAALAQVPLPLPASRPGRA